MKRPALEAAFDKASGVMREHCQVCRGPLSSRTRAPILVLHEGGEFGACSACGRPVDGEGRSVCTVNDRGVAIVESVVFGSHP